jgi:predicted secreted protein
MAVGTTGSAVSITAPSRGNYLLPMILMISLYFSIGFITSLNDILVPHFKDLFHLTNVLLRRVLCDVFAVGLDRRSYRVQAGNDWSVMHGSIGSAPVRAGLDRDLLPTFSICALYRGKWIRLVAGGNQSVC